MVIPYKPGRCITDEKKQVAFIAACIFTLNAKRLKPNAKHN